MVYSPSVDGVFCKYCKCCLQLDLDLFNPVTEKSITMKVSHSDHGISTCTKSVNSSDRLFVAHAILAQNLTDIFIFRGFKKFSNSKVLCCNSIILP